ncbi:hypothetical protein M5689_024555 [Euphorbia peplus]|nr:hypothetical protein M5689_024555 [Euphorbia peplus]
MTKWGSEVGEKYQPGSYETYADLQEYISGPACLLVLQFFHLGFAKVYDSLLLLQDDGQQLLSVVLTAGLVSIA